MKVPFVDLGRMHATIRPEIDAAIGRVIEGSSFVGAGASRSFEEAFAEAHLAPAAAGCGSGTDALALALRALGVGPGDEVVLPAMTFIASAEAVVHVGATPVIADVDPVTLLLTEATVDAVRTDRTRAVMPVHLYGHVVPFDLIGRWRDGGLIVVEDAAQAHLATWQGEPVGSRGHAACFSFYPGKNLGAMGDAGAVISRDDALVQEVRRLRDHGRASKYTHDVVGWCSRLDGMQAAILEVKLGHLVEWTAGRRAAAARYRELLGDLLVPWEEGAVHHLLVMRSEERDVLGTALDAAGIGWGIHYPVALTDQPAMEQYVTKPAPEAELGAASVLSLPMDPLLTEAEVEAAAGVVAASMGRTSGDVGKAPRP